MRHLTFDIIHRKHSVTNAETSMPAPFPGEYPTKLAFKVDIVGRAEPLIYIGKPNREYLNQLLRAINKAKWSNFDYYEFDRKWIIAGWSGSVRTKMVRDVRIVVDPTGRTAPVAREKFIPARESKMHPPRTAKLLYKYYHPFSVGSDIFADFKVPFTNKLIAGHFPYAPVGEGKKLKAEQVETYRQYLWTHKFASEEQLGKEWVEGYRKKLEEEIPKLYHWRAVCVNCSRNLMQSVVSILTQPKSRRCICGWVSPGTEFMRV